VAELVRLVAIERPAAIDMAVLEHSSNAVSMPAIEGPSLKGAKVRTAPLPAMR
jgi:hypothetical protein